jgi:hypothetical protein
LFEELRRKAFVGKAIVHVPMKKILTVSQKISPDHILPAGGASILASASGESIAEDMGVVKHSSLASLIELILSTSNLIDVRTDEDWGQAPIYLHLEGSLATEQISFSHTIPNQEN